MNINSQLYIKITQMTLFLKLNRTNKTREKSLKFIIMKHAFL